MKTAELPRPAGAAGRMGLVGEAMVALTLTQAVLEKFGGDSLEEFQRNVKGYRDEVRARGWTSQEQSSGNE